MSKRRNRNTSSDIHVSSRRPDETMFAWICRELEGDKTIRRANMLLSILNAELIGKTALNKIDADCEAQVLEVYQRLDELGFDKKKFRDARIKEWFGQEPFTLRLGEALDEKYEHRN